MANSVAAAVPAERATPFSMRAILVPLTALIIGIFMAVLDATAVNVAVPTLVRDFHDKLSTVQWVVTGYTLAQAAVIPLAGWLSDRYGAKRIFLTSIVLFTLGSALCATAQGSGMLIAFRVLQGLGGGFVLPVGMAYVYRLAPPERVGAVMGMMGIPILFAPAIGPVLAGWLVQYADWRWIFLINVPIGVVGVFVGVRGLPESLRQSVGRLDLAGIILAPLAFVALCYGISEGSSSWSSTNTLAGLIVGIVALVAFIAAELRAPNPLLELRVFKSVDFSVAILVQWVGQFALFGTLFLVPLFLQEVRGYGAFDTGLTLLPQALAAGVFMPIGGMLFDRIGARPLVIAGSAIMAIAAFMLSTVSVTTQGRDLIVPLAMYGAGMGLMLMPLNTQVINAAPRKLVSRVTALTNALQQVVSSLTIAALATILTSRATTHISAAQQAVAARYPHPAGKPLPPELATRMGHELQRAAIKGLSFAFQDTFHIMVVGAVISAVMGLLLRRNLAAQRSGSVEEGQGTEQPPLLAHVG